MFARSWGQPKRHALNWQACEEIKLRFFDCPTVLSGMRRRCFCAASCMATVSVLVAMLTHPIVAAPVEAESTDRAEKRLHLKIAMMAKALPRLKIDGKADEWGAFTVVEDEEAKSDRSLSPGTDITHVGCLPMEKGLAVLVVTRGDMPASGGTLWIAVDIGNRSSNEFAVGLVWNGPHHVDYYRPKGRGRMRVRVVGIRAAKQGGVAEAWLPWDVLIGSLPTELAKVHLLGNRKDWRNWVRVRVHSFDHARGVGTQADRGAAAASYFIQAKPGPLDHAYPVGSHRSAVTGWPLRGTTFISQGAFTQFTHKNQWAWDVVVVDPSMRRTKHWSARHAKMDDDFIWGAPIYSGTKGRVRKVVDEHPDRPRGQPGERDTANHVQVERGDRLVEVYVHTKLGSAKVREGQVVQEGQVLGAVGNSGNTTNAHLHIHVRDLNGKRVPVAFRNLRVRLNQSENDPWERNLTSWIPREGYFVDPLVQRR